MVLVRVTEEDDRFEAWIVSCFCLKGTAFGESLAIQGKSIRPEIETSLDKLMFKQLLCSLKNRQKLCHSTIQIHFVEADRTCEIEITCNQ